MAFDNFLPEAAKIEHFLNFLNFLDFPNENAILACWG